MVAKHSPVTYSGGRYAAWLMAEALLEAGHRVVYLTNHRPVFASEVPVLHGRGCGVELVTGNLLLSRLPEQRFDVVVVIPHLHIKRMLDNDWVYYFRAISRAERDGAMVVLLSFETPNWIEELLSDGRDPQAYRYWRKYAANAHLILSISKEGSKYARDYYVRFNKNLMFADCYPPINSRACDAVPDQAKENRIVLITRFGDAHKNAQSIVRLIDASLCGYTLEVVQGVGSVPRDTLDAMVQRCKEYGVCLEVRERIADKEKFTDLKRAKLLVFPSLFEGFGIPPVEAQYCGTRVLAFDLPVLREVNRCPENIQFVARGDYEALRRRSAQLVAEPYDERRVRRNIAGIARFENYVERVDRAVSSAHSLFLTTRGLTPSDARSERP
jgi:glycosyltransferase involved in cell wall biosynthesis